MSNRMSNSATLVGRLGADPEKTTFQNGNSVMKFSLATNESWYNDRQEKQEKTTWHNVEVYLERLIPLVENYLKKGSRIGIEGKIASRKYEKEGNNYVYNSIEARELMFLDTKSEATESETQKKEEEMSI